MENQHRRINGYRELSQEDIDLMNAIKSKGLELMELHEALGLRLLKRESELKRAITDTDAERRVDSDAAIALRLFEAAEPYRWHSIGKTDVQTGIMALVRAVAQPQGV